MPSKMSRRNIAILKEAIKPNADLKAIAAKHKVPVKHIYNLRYEYRLRIAKAMKKKTAAPEATRPSMPAPNVITPTDPFHVERTYLERVALQSRTLYQDAIADKQEAYERLKRAGLELEKMIKLCDDQRDEISVLRKQNKTLMKILSRLTSDKRGRNDEDDDD